MRRFPKLLAVVLAIAIIICPAMCLTSMAETTNAYDVQFADNKVTVTIDADFLVALLKLDVEGYSIDESAVTVTTDPVYSFSANPDFDAENGVLKLLVASKEAANIAMVSSATITIPVTEVEDATRFYIALTNIQAADAGTADAPESFLDFDGVDTATGAVENVTSVIPSKCEHKNMTSEVIVEATKDAEGVRKYTCECGHTEEVAIAKPALYSVSGAIGGTLFVSDKFGYRLGTKLSESNKFASYKMVVETKYYEGDNYVITDDVQVFTAADKLDESTSTYDYFRVYSAAYAVDFDINATLYFYDADGNTVYYLEKTYNIAERAQKYVKDSVASGDLRTAKFYMDMLNYCAAAQDYFKTDSNGLKDAVLVNNGMDEYKQHASQTTPDYNSIKVNENPVVNEAVAKLSKLIVVADSTYIRYTVTLPAGSDGSNLKIKVTYRSTYTNKDATYPLIVREANVSELEVNPNNATQRYFYFTDAALYDAHVSVNAKIIDTTTGNTIAENDYNIANFIASRLGNAAYPTMQDLMSTMAKFTATAREFFDYDPIA